MRIYSIVGTRPQLIKASVIDREASLMGADIEHITVHTGQHYDAKMSSHVIKSLGMCEPKYNLGVGSGSHGQMTGRMIAELESLFQDHQPDWILNYGDTNTTLACALAASKLGIKMGHVEAGMRRYDLSIPEEINRRVTDHISQKLYVSSNIYADQLKLENVPGDILNVGDINYDAYLYMKKIISLSTNTINERFYLSTIHRPHNADSKRSLQNIAELMAQLDTLIILALHPRTRKNAAEFGIQFSDNVRVIDPLDHFELIKLLENCSGVLTDSGGLQKEAYFAEKPCVTFAEDTPWRELKNLGVNYPVGSDNLNPSVISDWMRRKKIYTSKVYGDGSAGNKILRSIIDHE